SIYGMPYDEWKERFQR
ncbi:MAG: DUF1244 domain-containing protein, partial [Moraxellaceae bacterium]|nr:DUF1244 domain-containing protein [Moraxellaceae bacterium]